MEKRDNNSSSDLEHKLEIVENKLVFIKEQYESAIRFFKITLTSISGFFGVISILVVVLSLFSKSEVTNAIREMERKFDVLSQQALKLPKLDIFYKDEVVSGKTISITIVDNIVLLNKLFIKNIGEKIANNITIKIYCNSTSNMFGFLARENYDWKINDSSDEKFPLVIELKEKLVLSPQEVWPFPMLRLDQAVTFENNRHMDEILLDTLMKLEVYYGLGKPVVLEIKFEKPADNKIKN